MALQIQALIDAAVSHALASGYFDRVNAHEPKSAPGRGITASVWVERISPYARNSGLAATSALVVLNVRVYTNMVSEPQDAIDPELTLAVDSLMNAYNGDFMLDGLVSSIDLLNASGAGGLEARAGYIEIDKTLFRVMTITLPLIVNDVWTQVA